MKSLRRIFALSFATVGLCGCATPTTLQLDQSLHETVLVYPMFDARENKDISTLFDGGVDIAAHPISSYYMGANFGCIIRNAADVGISPNAVYADFSNGTEQLRRLNRNDEKYVFAIFLGEMGWKGGSTTAIASVAGFLVDAETGVVVWSNSAEDTEWAGLVGGMTRFMYQGDANRNNPVFAAWDNALTKMLTTFPNLTKKQLDDLDDKE